MGKILPVLIALIGLGAGIGAGLALRPPPPEPPASEGEQASDPAAEAGGEAQAAAETAAAEKGAEGENSANSEFVKMNNQFVIPIVNDEKVAALVVMSLSLELTPGGTDVFYQREPKLRDALLQALFDHANAGGFDGVFTAGSKLDALRVTLIETATRTLGPVVKDVLVTDLLRQDV